MSDAALPSPPLRPPLRPRRGRMPRTILALMMREMTTTYGRSPGGYVWAVAEPVAAIFLLSFVFSIAFRTPSLGDNFPFFYATAYLPFGLFNIVSMKVAQSLRFSRQLLAYPAVTWVDAVLARFAVNMITQLMVFVLVMGGIVWAFDLNPIIDLERVVLALALAAFLAAGIGMLNCFLMSMFGAWQSIWTILTRPLLILSAVFFIFEEMPASFQAVLWWNPLVHVTGLMRTAFFSTYEARYASELYVCLWAIVPLFLGTALIGRYHRILVNER